MYGTILDVGGGGEGVIGQIYGNRVMSIDNRQDELDEAPNCCEKRLMDAMNLLFPDSTFDNVTFFYSLMYMSHDTQSKAIKEALRVLKSGGKLCIWDANIRSAYPDPFIVDLDIVSTEIRIQTTYGIVKNEAQNFETVLEYLKNSGQTAITGSVRDEQFFICCEKR